MSCFALLYGREERQLMSVFAVGSERVAERGPAGRPAESGGARSNA